MRWGGEASNIGKTQRLWAIWTNNRRRMYTHSPINIDNFADNYPNTGRLGMAGLTVAESARFLTSL